MDAFCFYLLLLIGIQIWYMIIAGDYPKNAFIAGVGSPLGIFAITSIFILLFIFFSIILIILVCLRMQINKETKY